LDESIDRYLGIREREEPSIEEFEFRRTVELTGHREVPRMTGVMGIDEQTCPFEELRTRQDFCEHVQKRLGCGGRTAGFRPVIR